MTVTSCPTDEIQAPIGVVWGLLMDPGAWGTFWDVRIRGVDPQGRAHVGQRVIGESGPTLLHLEVSFVFTLVDEKLHRIGLDINLPFGLNVKEDLDCAALGRDRCRVNYHCQFDFPRGPRGWVLQRLLRRELDRGPADSLSRLKRRAETEASKVSL